MSSHGWYVAVEETTRGPAPTDLVIKGIEHRKVPPEAMVCEVGTGRWVPLASVPVFHAAVVRSYPPPPPGSEEARAWLEQGFRFPPPAPLPRFGDAAPPAAPLPRFDDVVPPPAPAPLPRFAPASPLPPPSPPAAARVSAESIPDDEVAEVVEVASPEAPEARAPAASLSEIDVEVCEGEHTPIDWTESFASSFLVDDDVTLPDEDALLASLRAASRETFRHEESLWNLALCLAYGSDEVGAAAARAFFDAAGDQGGDERIAWMRRALEGSGFMPSGIPEDAGRRAFARLRSTCPPSLGAKLS